MSSSLIALRTQSEATTNEQKRLIERKKGILLLIHDYLIENGYIDSATKLAQEANGILSKHSLADNIDLDLVLAEYETYYEIKFNKKPKIIKKLNDNEINPRIKYNISNDNKQNKSKKSEDKDKLPSITNINGPENEELGIQGNNFSKSKKQDEINEDRSLKPPPQFGGDNEMKQLAASISREIYQESPNVRFSDIISLNEAKRLLCEAIQLPLKYPNIFVGILRPWRGILLHGPPGTGKTMLAKAVATECKTTFFNISASSLVSKWRGDSEKLVRVLFELARYHAPSTIFLDEIDSILTSRGGEGQEHEASRRMKTELLIQMDGVKGNVNNSSTKSIDQVFVMAASNLPWDLDIAVLRRLEKRVLVGIPTKEARETMLKKHLSDRSSNDFDFSKISDLTNGYSGADIELLCREAAMMPVRRLMIKINALDENKLTIEPPQPPVTNKSLNTNRNIISKVSISSSSLTIDPDTLIKSDPVTMDDILNALDTTRPSSDGNMMKYEAWQQEYGSS